MGINMECRRLTAIDWVKREGAKATGEHELLAWVWRAISGRFLLSLNERRETSLCLAMSTFNTQGRWCSTFLSCLGL